VAKINAIFPFKLLAHAAQRIDQAYCTTPMKSNSCSLNGKSKR